MFKFNGEKLNGGNFRPFSVASTQDENIITILTKIGDNPSEFKSRLKSMEIGDIISLRGPFGGFYISDYNQAIAMIAGGIEITPRGLCLSEFSYENLYILSHFVFAEKNQGTIQVRYIEKNVD